MSGEQISLSLPDARFQESYICLCSEFCKRGEPLIPFTLQYPHDDFAGFIRRLKEESTGEGLPEGFVAHTTYWLIRGGAEVIGVSDLRHGLNERLQRRGGHIGYGIKPSERRKGYGSLLLQLTLDRARELGIAEALLTCGKENQPSARVIMNNGGIMRSEEYLAEHNETVCRFIIPLEQPGAVRSSL